MYGVQNNVQLDIIWLMQYPFGLEPFQKRTNTDWGLKSILLSNLANLESLDIHSGFLP